MIQASFDFDITARKHANNPQSRAAHSRVAPAKQNWRTRILTLMAIRGTLTLLDACKAFSKERGQLSGRFSELKALNLIEPTGEVIDGFTEYRMTK